MIADSTDADAVGWPGGPDRPPIEGRVDIEMRRAAGGAGVEARVSSRRPLDVCRLLVGREASEAPRLASLIFSVCGMAQGAASVSALEDALGAPAAASTRLAREVVVAAETVREHALRVALDWPRFLGEAPDGGVLAGARELASAPRRLAVALFGDASPFDPGVGPAPDWQGVEGVFAGMNTALEQVVFGVAPGAWLSACTEAGGAPGEAFERWAASSGAIASRFLFEVVGRRWSGVGAVSPRFLQALDREVLLARLCMPDSRSFVAAPDWMGFPCETGALARESNSELVRFALARWGAGLLARLLARLVELARLSGVMRAGLDEIRAFDGQTIEADGTGRGSRPCFGLAQVEAARGRLIHAVELRSGRVERYWIVAPTEWNFHPDGAAAAALARLDAEDDAELLRQAELVVHAIDPCTAFDLRVA